MVDMPDFIDDALKATKNFLGDIGIDVDNIVDLAGMPLEAVADLVRELGSVGIDVITTAGVFGLSPTGFILQYLRFNNGNTHQELSERLTSPLQSFKTGASNLTNGWQDLHSFHSETLHLIDNEIRDIFGEGGEYAYSGPAAQTLSDKQQELHKDMIDLLDIVSQQGQGMGRVDQSLQSFFGQIRSKVFALPGPVATVGYMLIALMPAAPIAIGAGAVAILGALAQALAALVVLIVLVIAIEWLIEQLIELIKWLWEQLQRFWNWLRSQSNEPGIPSRPPTQTRPRPPKIRTKPRRKNKRRKRDDCDNDQECLEKEFPELDEDIIELLLKYYDADTVYDALYEILRVKKMDHKELEAMIKELQTIRRAPSLTDPNGSGLSEEDIAKFIVTYPDYIPDIWDMYTKSKKAGVDNMSALLLDMANGSPTSFKGSYYQLTWVYEHRDLVRKVEDNVGSEHGIDVILDDGTYIELKSWLIRDTNTTLQGKKLLLQIERYRNEYGDVPLGYVFDRNSMATSDRDLPPELKQMFTEGKVSDSILDAYIREKGKKDPSYLDPARREEIREEVEDYLKNLSYDVWPD